MLRGAAAALCVLILVFASEGKTADRMRFWNLTGADVANLQLAPAGTERWSSNQCKNDPDGAVSPDERLELTGITPGRYDVRLGTSDGRACLVRNVEVKSGQSYAFSLSESDLVDCTKRER